MDVEASILARITKKVNIILIGNPLPLGNPLRLAEELAMIDVISGGRLVTGWVRGAGSEQFALNANPAYNREYFNEAHDFIVKAWTQPGPWRYEGKHFHYRFVDPWPLPMQKPHPQMWIPGLLSPETAMWCAQKRYPYIASGDLPGADPGTVEYLPRHGGRGRATRSDRRISATCRRSTLPRPKRRPTRSPSRTCSAAREPATACSPNRSSIFLRGTIPSSPPGGSRTSSGIQTKAQQLSLPGREQQFPGSWNFQRSSRSSFQGLAGAKVDVQTTSASYLRFPYRRSKELEYHLRHSRDRHSQIASGDGNVAARYFHPVAE